MSSLFWLHVERWLPVSSVADLPQFLASGGLVVSLVVAFFWFIEHYDKVRRSNQERIEGLLREIDEKQSELHAIQEHRLRRHLRS